MSGSVSRYVAELRERRRLRGASRDAALDAARTQALTVAKWIPGFLKQARVAAHLAGPLVGGWSSVVSVVRLGARLQGHVARCGCAAACEVAMAIRSRIQWWEGVARTQAQLGVERASAHGLLGANELRRMSKLGVHKDWRPVSVGSDHVGDKVYFAEVCGTDLVKIGWSRVPTRRVRQLSRSLGLEVRLLGCILGGPAHERRVHRELEAWRGFFRGCSEVFRGSDEVLGYMHACGVL